MKNILQIRYIICSKWTNIYTRQTDEDLRQRIVGKRLTKFNKLCCILFTNPLAFINLKIKKLKWRFYCRKECKYTILNIGKELMMKTFTDLKMFDQNKKCLDEHSLRRLKWMKWKVFIIHFGCYLQQLKQITMF